ncbi:MAG: hypothetical protein LAO79_05805 [Acidobacteriia bacterium]|nr:hypothetical protein [Terriglobia bacterium]
MFDLRRYWQEIRALEGALPQYLWIVDAAGVLIEVTARIGAKMLHAKSHRVATEDEVAAHRDREEAKNREAAAEKRRRNGVEVVAVE